MAESFFDIVSRVDRQEVDNALNQAAKEISTRFDFRGVGAAISWSGEAVEIRANSEERAKAVLDVFKDKLVRRGVSLKALDASDPKPSGKEFRLGVGLKQGISQDDATGGGGTVHIHSRSRSRSWVSAPIPVSG